MFRFYVYLVVLVLTVGNLFGKSIPDHRQNDDAEIDEADTIWSENDVNEGIDGIDGLMGDIMLGPEQIQEMRDYALSHVLENEGIDGLFEGDIMLSPEEWEAMMSSSEEKEAMFRNAKKRKTLWQNGNIPYKFRDSYPKDQKEEVIKAIVQLNELINADGECIRFRPAKEGDENGFTINDKTDGCASWVGDRPEQWQTVDLKPNTGPYHSGCVHPGTIQHELIHLLGFWHEQSRSDRDDYVKIHFENIKEGMAYNFQKYDTDNQGFPYDYGSLMHYGAKDFSKNGKKTIETPNGEEIGQREAPTSQDIAEIRRYYSCD